MPPRPPYVDTHEVTLDRSRGAVRAGLDAWVARLIGRGPSLATRILGTEPPAGFTIFEQGEDGVTLEGRHRFSTYLLVLEVAGDRPTTLRAHTYAAFPGPAGRAYEVLVIRSRLHVLATRWMLRRAGSG